MLEGWKRLCYHLKVRKMPRGIGIYRDISQVLKSNRIFLLKGNQMSFASFIKRTRRHFKANRKIDSNLVNQYDVHLKFNKVMKKNTKTEKYCIYS